MKIASGFYQNPALGLSSSQGLMLLFEQPTGCLAAILLDEGHLTDARTAAAGAMSVFYLAKKDISRITILGAGIQAREQAKALLKATDCRHLTVWARNQQKGLQLCEELRDIGYQASFQADCQRAVKGSDVVMTTTPATVPLIQAEWVQPGTFIVAVGADTPDKRELDPLIVAQSHRVISDSLSQATSRGEVYQAVKTGSIEMSKVLELGFCLQHGEKYRQAQHETYVVDLTGVAVQDLAIASAVFHESTAHGG